MDNTWTDHKKTFKPYTDINPNSMPFIEFDKITKPSKEELEESKKQKDLS